MAPWKRPPPACRRDWHAAPCCCRPPINGAVLERYLLSIEGCGHMRCLHFARTGIGENCSQVRPFRPAAKRIIRLQAVISVNTVLVGHTIARYSGAARSRQFVVVITKAAGRTRGVHEVQLGMLYRAGALVSAPASYRVVCRKLMAPGAQRGPSVADIPRSHPPPPLCVKQESPSPLTASLSLTGTKPLACYKIQ